MRIHRLLATALLSSFGMVQAQTAEELVAKNTEAKGGVAKIKSIKSLRMEGRMEVQGITAKIRQDQKAPQNYRNEFTVQGMTQIQSFDGKTGWQISPFQGRKDPEMLGEDDLRDIEESADFYGPLIDWQQKGNKIEYLGHDVVDGDDALKLKVTLKNGDIINYYLDPDSYLEIKTEKQMFIRGSIKEMIARLGSYKQVDGVYFPYAIESGAKRDPALAKTTFDRIEANLPLSDAEFIMPPQPPVPSPQKHGEPPKQVPPPEKPKETTPTPH
jgi:hypothetical protein